MPSPDALTLHEMFAAGADFAEALERAVAETTYEKQLYMISPDTTFDTPMLKVVWSWQRTDTIQYKLSPHTIEQNSSDWPCPPMPADLPTTISVEWRGETYEISLIHTRTSGTELYTDEASPFYVTPTE
ncbi:MAG: hypothetical protein VX730_09590 [Pseudomonadota bacterium]|nr:hypothetical protein [Pseudomonadota bacterium]